MANEKKIILVHPALGERAFSEAAARRLMAMVKNGGWEYKERRSRKSNNQPGDAINIGPIKGEAETTIEEGDNQPSADA